MSLTVVHVKRMRFRAEIPHVPSLVLTFRVDGVQYGPYLGGAATGMDGFQIGSNFNIDGSINDFDIDNVKVGSTAGAADIFAATFASALVPPFDSESLSGGDGALTVTGGVLHVSGNDPSQVLAAVKEPLPGGPFLPIYLQNDVRFSADMIAAGGATGDPLDTVGVGDPLSTSGVGDVYAGYWFDFEAGGWGVYCNSIEEVIPFTLEADRWYTVGLHIYRARI